METASTLPWQAAAPGRERRLATVGVLLALVVAAFETTVVTTAMPTLTAELNGRAFYAWVFTGFLLASTLGVLPRWPALRPARPARHLRRRDGPVPPRLGALWLLHQRADAGRLPGPAGTRRRRGAADDADHQLGPLHARGAGGDPERLHRRLGAGLRHRTGGGRSLDRAPRLALGVLGERPGRSPRGGDAAPLVPGPAPEGAGPLRGRRPGARRPVGDADPPRPRARRAQHPGGCGRAARRGPCRLGLRPPAAAKRRSAHPAGRASRPHGARWAPGRPRHRRCAVHAQRLRPAVDDLPRWAHRARRGRGPRSSPQRMGGG